MPIVKYMDEIISSGKNLHIGEGGGGGGSAPTFTETLIGSDTSLTGTVTFTDDPSDYDLLKVVLYNSSSQRITQIITTASMIDAINTTLSSVVWNEYANNQYCTYNQPTSSTWVRIDARNLFIKEVYGLTCDNFTVSETEIYNRGSYTVSDVTISGTDLLDYDLILTSMAYDGIQMSLSPSYKGIAEDSDTERYAIVNPYGSMIAITITDTQMSAASYFNAVGIKFT